MSRTPTIHPSPHPLRKRRELFLLTVLTSIRLERVPNNGVKIWKVVVVIKTVKEPTMVIKRFKTFILKIESNKVPATELKAKRKLNCAGTF